VETDMPTQVIIDNPYVTMWYYPEKKILHHKIHKFIFGDQFQEMLLSGTEVLRKNLAQKWLSDDRNNSVLKQEDLEWSEAQWAPLTAKAGWKYWAIVQPDKVLGQLAMQRLTDKYAPLGVTAKVFTDPAAAMSWLEMQ
jgi:hypothetical protein